MRYDLLDPLLPAGDKTRKPLILVVDDEDSNLAFYEACLEEEGYQVAKATNGKDALNLAEEEDPDLVLLDVRMPVMDGFTACKEMRERETTRYTPILFLTALGEEEHVQEGIQCGADDFLAKPVHADELRIRVRSLLKIRKYRDELHRAVSYIRILQEESEKMRKASLG
jgi:DNA-binding response OmpR family regulator